jgi:hypothetical protein
LSPIYKNGLCNPTIIYAIVASKNGFRETAFGEILRNHALVPGGGRDQRGTILQEQLHHLSVIILGRQVDRLLVLVVVEVHHGVQIHQLLARLL